jgi:hypothetical protein
MSDEINFLGLFDKYMTKEVEVCQMADEQHFLVDLYVNELWEVRKCYPKKYYDEKRKQWFEFEPVEFICNTKQFGSPNGYFTMELKPIIETILQKDYKIQSAIEELEKLLDWEVKCKNINLHTENSVPVELIEQRLKWLKKGVEK